MSSVSSFVLISSLCALAAAPVKGRSLERPQKRALLDDDGNDIDDPPRTFCTAFLGQQWCDGECEDANFTGECTERCLPGISANNEIRCEIASVSTTETPACCNFATEEWCEYKTPTLTGNFCAAKGDIAGLQCTSTCTAQGGLDDEGELEGDLQCSSPSSEGFEYDDNVCEIVARDGDDRRKMLQRSGRVVVRLYRVTPLCRQQGINCRG